MPHHRPFLAATLRALDRLNPKLLSTGGSVNHTEAGVTCCALGALQVHLGSRGSGTPIPPTYPRLRAAADSGWQDSYVAADTRAALITRNETFRYGQNDRPTQEARYRHVRAWVERELAKLPKP